MELVLPREEFYASYIDAIRAYKNNGITSYSFSMRRAWRFLSV